jgi:hypothetical protein
MRHVALHVVYALLRTDDRRHVGVGRHTSLLDERFVDQRRRRSGGEHRVDQQHRLPFETSARDVLDLDGERSVLLALAVGRYEGVLRVVEIVQEALVKRKACAQDRGDDDFVVVELDFGLAERCLDRAGRVAEPFRDFVGHQFADAFQIAAETHRIALDPAVADLGDELVEDGVLSVQNVDLHNAGVLDFRVSRGSC